MGAMSMVPASQLRVYEPLDAFSEEQRARWVASINADLPRPLPWAYRDAPVAPGEVGLLFPVDAGHASVRRVHGEAVICPGSVRMGVLAAVVACHDDDDACGSLVPREEVQRAAGELARLNVEDPGEQDHVLFSAWHVPFRWLAAFDDAERILTAGAPPGSAGRPGQRARTSLRYETDLSVAIARLERAESILDAGGMDDSIVTPVADLAEWLSAFDPESTLELDYGGLAALIAPDLLEADRSAGEIWACLEAMELGDLDECHRRYAELATWWEQVRSIERQN
jgi:hypothetical protein